MKRTLFTLGAILTTAQLFSALPPFYQAKREIEAILSSQEINQYIPVEDTIMQISKTPMGYMIITDHRLVAVHIIHKAERQVGPARFTLDFQCPVEFKNDDDGPCEDGSCR